MLLLPPICGKLETLFKEKVFPKPMTPSGEFQDESEFVLAKFYKAKVKGLDFWGGPVLVDSALVLIKHPIIDHKRRGLGETNAIFQFGGYMFASGLETNPLLAFRPLYNQDLRSDFEKSVSALDVKKVARFLGMLD